MHLEVRAETKAVHRGNNLAQTEHALLMAAVAIEEG